MASPNLALPSICHRPKYVTGRKGGPSRDLKNGITWLPCHSPSHTKRHLPSYGTCTVQFSVWNDTLPNPIWRRGIFLKNHLGIISRQFYPAGWKRASGSSTFEELRQYPLGAGSLERVPHTRSFRQTYDTELRLPLACGVTAGYSNGPPALLLYKVTSRRVHSLTWTRGYEHVLEKKKRLSDLIGTIKSSFALGKHPTVSNAKISLGKRKMSQN